MMSTPTTATTSWPTRSSIGVWLLPLLALLAIGQIKQAAGLECECGMNIVNVTTENLQHVFNDPAAPLLLKRDVGDWLEWNNATIAYFKAVWSDPGNIYPSYFERQVREVWPGCNDGMCRIEKNDNDVWQTMKRIQYSHWENITETAPVHLVNDDYQPACVKAHMTPLYDTNPLKYSATTFQFTGCAIQPPPEHPKSFNWLDLNIGTICNKTTGAKFGHDAFCVLEILPPRTAIPTTAATSAVTSQPATESTTTPKANGTTHASTSASAETTTSGAPKRATEPIVAMAAAILLSLAATRLLPTTTETG